jgi:hypothetical protein
MRTIDTTKLEKAFALVCPAEHAKKLAAAGVLSAADAGRASWKDPISALVLESELRVGGVSIDDVVEAIRFYTATEPTFTAERIGHRAGDSARFIMEPSRPGWWVRADGYRAGPAGDH